MTPLEYQRLCTRSDSPEFTFPNIKLLHSALGCVTESAEFADAMKKSMFYNRPLDTTNIKEELGDLSWYISQALTALNLTWEDIWETNIAKLKTRYPHHFTCEYANIRNLPAERTTMEGQS